jgi:hypothetical protein
VLKQAIRTFFYQRINFAKQAPYTDAKWADGACFERSNQDRYATSRYAKGDLTTARDLSGGWMDAGDKNKYTTFAHNAVIELLESYRINPGVFKDNYNIPESGNGIPDLLDEVKWELDFLKRMQDATGTSGFILKVGTDNYNEITPPSADTRPRYYVPECTSATIAGCSMFAVAGVVFKTVPALSSYGLDLITRAEQAWSRAQTTTSSFTVFQTDCDDGDIKAGDADKTAQEQLDNLFVAAVYLYEATGKTVYKNFAESNYTRVNPYVINWWGPYWRPQQLALLRLTGLPSVSTTVINNIRNQKAGMNYLYSFPTYDAGTDLYKAHMETDAYHWGHNEARSNAGQLNMDFITFNINTTNQSKYRIVAEQYVHWLHGMNPFGLVMLSNMYNYGAEKCVNELYHTWFANGSSWDNALTSANGPAPGYVPGGPNKNYTGTLSYLTTEPPQKAYKDWNNDWPENSWEITEPSIYCQASYISLLSQIMTASPTDADTSAPSVPSNLSATSLSASSISLIWNGSSDNVGVTSYAIYNAVTNQLIGTSSSTGYTVNGLSCNTNYSYYVKALDAAGNSSLASNTSSATTSACLVTVSEYLYDEAVNTAWTGLIANGTVSYSSTTMPKNGSKSINVTFTNSGGILSFNRNSALTTTTNTQLRFWVFNNSKNGIKVYTHNATDTKSPDVFFKPAKGRWTELVISLSQLGNPTTIKKVSIQLNASTSSQMYLDDIRLVNVISGSGLLQKRNTVPSQEVAPVLKLFPNPASRQVTLSYHSTHAAQTRISLYDVNGKILLRKTINIDEGNNHRVLTLPELTQGQYFVEVDDGDLKKSIPLLIRH